jgi:hypothetical protein
MSNDGGDDDDDDCFSCSILRCEAHASVFTTNIAWGPRRREHIMYGASPAASSASTPYNQVRTRYVLVTHSLLVLLPTHKYSVLRPRT